jgi:probable O-glycosylation ligase (exosortase A-associated)
MPVRDIALTVLVAVLLAGIFKHPVMGAYVWAWLSLMNPHKMTYGFAFNLPFAQATAVLALGAFLLTSRRRKLPLSGIVGLQLALLAWMGVTSFFAMASSEVVLDRWIFVAKIHTMLLVTWMLVTDAKQLRTLIWIVTFSVCYFGIKGGVWTILTGGGGRVWGPPGGMLEDNNQLAVGLVVLMPMLYFLWQTEANKWLRRLLLLSMVTVVFSVLGSQSRGALLALLAMAFVLGIKGKYPVRTSLLLALLGVLAIGFMPDTWSNRMESMGTYQADGSAMSRIWTWTTLWNAAVDHPFVGVGFGADNQAVFARYAPLDGDFASFRGMVFVAHSIYFQMLGEHGFVGLTLFLLLGSTTWLTARAIAKRTKDDPEFGPWMPTLMHMVQVSLVGFAVGGAFLSLAYLDLPYYIMGFVVSAGMLERKRAKERAQAARGATAFALRSDGQAGPGRAGLAKK